MRAIVVDDSKAMRSVLRRMLADCGFDEVTEAENGLRALELLRSGTQADLALVDWNMPEMNGLEFVRSVRGDDRYRGVAIVMVTSESSADSLVEALQAGANEYLMKPFTKDALTEKLALVGRG
jgi:two-component system chemotaxis response regulator CheY